MASKRKKKTVAPNHWFSVQGWMSSVLGLSGFELFVFAIVWQFSHSKEGCYVGGVPYVSRWLGCTETTARKYLHSLEAKGFIVAIEGANNGCPFRHYRIAWDKLQNLQGIPQNLKGDLFFFGEDSLKKMGIDNNNYNHKEDIIREFAPNNKSQGRSATPTPKVPSPYRRKAADPCDIEYSY